MLMRFLKKNTERESPKHLCLYWLLLYPPSSLLLLLHPPPVFSFSSSLTSFTPSGLPSFSVLAFFHFFCFDFPSLPCWFAIYLESLDLSSYNRYIRGEGVSSSASLSSSSSVTTENIREEERRRKEEVKKTSRIEISRSLVWLLSSLQHCLPPRLLLSYDANLEPRTIEEPDKQER